MKVICDSCHAKYSLSDDKLTKGKTFKIKCKKCGHVIMVKPVDEGNADEESTRVVDYNAMSGGQAAASDADSKIWHVAIGDKTDGPFTVAEIVSQISAGGIPPDALAWNEGLPNWEKISTLSEFSANFPGEASASEPAPARHESAPARHEPAPSAPASEPAARRAESAPVVRNEPAPEPAAKGGGFFGAEEEDSSASQALKGQRHENSVLFSLDNLQNLAASSSKKPSPRPGYINPSSQGSGLVDIQEMAASMNTNKPARQDAVPFDLPAAPVVATPISIAPVLIPTQMDSERPKWMVPAIIGVVVAVVLVGGFAVWRMTGKKEGSTPPPAAQNNNMTPPANNVVVQNNNMTANNMTPPANNGMGPGDMPPDMPPDGDMPPDVMTPDSDMPPDMPPDGDMPPDVMTPDAMTPDSMEPSMTPDMGGRDPVVSMNPTMDPGMTEMTPDMPPNNDMPPGDSGCTKVWCMLKNNAPDCCAPFRGGSSEMGGGSDDPCANNANETLTPSDVKEGMSNVRSSVNACFSKFGISGKVTVRVSVGCMGSVQSASASGEHASSPLGGCIQKAVRGAKFPKFKKPSSKSFQYPFVGGG
ncbi:zinc-ribbon domain-containing protein [Myxococcota bacterium]|nr:zinc-ribbon domain-containing protein [Myxococcota bacterium]MBU1411672.1 zinc-ribbon domain-containing protein [Myxococcota bacterium]MBU1508955.1 zinc-ribbon domain-containing protein [Myxococcota bacterium]